MLTEKYLKIIIEEYLNKKDYLEINDFIKETGIERKEIISYINSTEDFREATIGIYVRK